MHHVPWLWVVLAIAGCATPPPPPPNDDGTPGGANRLALGEATTDRVDCGQNDCNDWFRTLIEADGDLRLEVTADHGHGLAGEFSVQLTDTTGAGLAADDSRGRGEVVLSHGVTGGRYLIEVTARDAERAVPYQIQAAFVPRPPPAPVVEAPPEPQYQTRSSPVLEVEGDASQSIVIDLGRSQGVVPGLRGRLVEQGRVLAEVVVEEVYDSGSRARVLGQLQQEITTSTVVEVDIPVAPSPVATEPD